MKKSTFLSFLFFGLIAFSFTSCDRDNNELVDVEAFTDGSIESLQRGAIGKNHCLEFIFPISIQFIDETTAEIESYESLHETVKAWFEANDVEKNRENKPQLVFPIQVLNKAGEVIDVASQDELKELRSECPKKGKCKGKKGRGFSCFTLVFPITISIDGVDTTFEERGELKAAVRAYKESAGEDAERPTLVFPVTVQYEDDTQVEVASQEELQALKEACQDEEG